MTDESVPPGYEIRQRAGVSSMLEITAAQPRSYRWRNWIPPSLAFAVLAYAFIFAALRDRDFGPEYLPGMGIMLFCVLVLTLPLWLMVSEVTVKADGLEARSYFGTSRFVPWNDFEEIGVYYTRPFFGEPIVYVKLIPRKNKGFTTRGIFFVPLTDNMSNFDQLVQALQAKPVGAGTLGGRRVRQRSGSDRRHPNGRRSLDRLGGRTVLRPS
jgi:hypothetical protein